MRTGPTNPELGNLIVDLKRLSIEQNKKLWKRIASDLEKPARSRRVINLVRIDKYVKDGETVIVPGKVLSGGDLTKKATVAAFKFSDSAFDKINKVGKAMTIKELMDSNPAASKVRILG